MLPSQMVPSGFVLIPRTSTVHLKEASIIPTLEELTHRFAKATVYSRLDAKSGYWCVQLDNASQLYTTFNSPFRRYCFKRLPFGLETSQDVFQKAMDQILEGLPGVVSIADDIVVYGTNEQDHDQNLHRLMQRARERGLVFNPTKCRIKEEEIPFFGNIYSKNRVRPDPVKVQAIAELKEPTNTTELQSFLGMITYLAPYIPKLSDHTAPLRKLLCKDSEFQWHHEQQSAFESLKHLICSADNLAYFDPSNPAVLQADASQEALGVALTQEGRPIAFASKSLTDTEKRYANIERELLACVFGALRFHTYLYGKPFLIESDHRPLEMISRKNLTAAPARLQRMLLRLQRYDYQITYKPGKEMTLPDSLSRLPKGGQDAEIDLNVKVCFVQFSTQKLNELREATITDPTLNLLMKYIVNGFPEKQRDIHSDVRCYWPFRDELSLENGIILKGEQTVIPESLRKCYLEMIHTVHQGINRCQQRARSCVYWPGMNQDIEDLISTCTPCQTHQASQQREPMEPLMPDVPNVPWNTIGTDLFTVNDQTYLIIADYYSKFPFVERLGKNLSSQSFADITSHIFSVFGAPANIISDNVPQFIGKPYQDMIRKYDINHISSSPLHPKLHGFIERMV